MSKTSHANNFPSLRLALGVLITIVCAFSPAARAQDATDRADAIRHYESMMDQDPGEIEAVLGLARNLRWAGLSQDADRVLEQNSVLFGGDGRYQAERGKVRLLQGRTAQGVRLLRQATETENKDWRLLSALGIGLDELGRHTDAQDAYAKALKLCPGDSAVMNNLGVSQALSGRLDQAVLTLQEAARHSRDPGHKDQIARNLKVFRDARDLCPRCSVDYLKTGGSEILASNLMDSDRESPCTPPPAFTQTAAVMAKRLTPETQTPTINIKVYFEFDSAILKPEAKEILDNLGRALTSKALASYRFQIAGHTDAVGSSAYNLELSKRRALAVLSYLTAHFEIDPTRLDAVGFGESRLLDPGDPESDVNRRVQVTRLGPA